MKKERIESMIRGATSGLIGGMVGVYISKETEKGNMDPNIVFITAIGVTVVLVTIASIIIFKTFSENKKKYNKNEDD